MYRATPLLHLYGAMLHMTIENNATETTPANSQDARQIEEMREAETGLKILGVALVAYTLGFFMGAFDVRNKMELERFTRERNSR